MLVVLSGTLRLCIGCAPVTGRRSSGGSGVVCFGQETVDKQINPIFWGGRKRTTRTGVNGLQVSQKMFMQNMAVGTSSGIVGHDF